MYYKQGESLGTYFDQKRNCNILFMFFSSGYKLSMSLPQLQDKGKSMSGKLKSNFVYLNPGGKTCKGEDWDQKVE